MLIEILIQLLHPLQMKRNALNLNLIEKAVLIGQKAGKIEKENQQV